MNNKIKGALLILLSQQKYGNDGLLFLEFAVGALKHVCAVPFSLGIKLLGIFSPRGNMKRNLVFLGRTLRGFSVFLN